MRAITWRAQDEVYTLHWREIEYRLILNVPTPLHTAWIMKCQMKISPDKDLNQEIQSKYRLAFIKERKANLLA